MTAAPAAPPGTNVLYHVVCGAPPAVEAEIPVRLEQAAGWDVCLIASPNAVPFVDVAALRELTGHPVRSAYKHPTEPDVLPPANALVVAPATFNTLNKIVHGVADTLAVSLVCEYLGLGVPVVVAPNLNPALARHPAYRESVERLRGWGVTVLSGADAKTDVKTGTGTGARTDGDTETGTGAAGLPVYMAGWEQVVGALPSL
jgi:phosphopantothenoylcysteine synthetase/decarboxylase